jgi:glycerol-3-phosphate acyltransferase PlsY
MVAIIALFVISLLLAYLIGSLPFAYLYGMIFKEIDIRQHGSGNVGATNVLRVFGTLPGIIVLLLDMLKGFIPVFVVLYHVDTDAQWFPVVIGITAILGHTFSCFLEFKGGKGVATSAGVLFALVPYEFLAAFFIFIMIVALSRYVSLGSMLACISLVLMLSFEYYLAVEKESFNFYIYGFVVLLTLFIIYKHKSNIIRLIKGTENKIKFFNA